MKLYLIRHAKSKRNSGQVSDRDTELNEDGIEQARRLGAWFKKAKVNHIYCSKLKRAKDTLKWMLAGFNGISITYTAKINEHNMGIYSKDGHDDWASYFKAADESGKPTYDFRPKQGESFSELQSRAGKFYKMLVKKYKNKNVLIVGHGFFLKHLILHALDLDASEGRFFGLENASVSELHIDNKNKVTRFYVNDFHHILLEAMRAKKKPKLLRQMK